MATTKQKGDDFETEVDILLRAMGFVVERDVLSAGTQLDFVARFPGPFDNRKLVVECTDRADPVGVPLIKEKSGALFGLEDGSTFFQLLIVSRNGFTRKARAFAESNCRVDLVTLRELEQRLVDFTPYVDAYVYSYQSGSGMFREGRLAELDASGNLVDRYVGLSGRLANGQPVASLQREVAAWATGRRDNLLFLLGEYGSGKTSFCRHFVYESLLAWQSEQPNAILPILLNLRDCRGEFRISEAVVHTLHERWGVRIASYAALERVCKAGRVVLVLDGLDEMAEVNDERALAACFAQVYLVAQLGIPILVSCRTNFFNSNQDLLQHLKRIQVEVPISASDGAPLVPLRFDQRATVLHVAKLSNDQVREYVFKRIGEDATDLLARISEIHDLTDLSTRPVLLDMILTTLPVLAKSEGEVNSAALYDHYTSRWTARDDWRVAIPPDVRQALCDSLAIVFKEDGVAEITASALQSILIRALGEEVTPDELRRYHTDLTVCSFLVRGGPTSTFRFAHKSFVEFFYARRLADEIGARLRVTGDAESDAQSDAKSDGESATARLARRDDRPNEIPRFVAASMYPWPIEEGFGLPDLRRAETETVLRVVNDFARLERATFASLRPAFGIQHAVRAMEDAKTDPLPASNQRGTDLITTVRQVLETRQLSAAGSTYGLTDEIATFAVECLANSALPFTKLLAARGRLSPETLNLLSDLLRMWRPAQFGADLRQALREVAFDEHATTRMRTAAAVTLAASEYGLSHEDFLALKDSMPPNAWSATLFESAQMQDRYADVLKEVAGTLDLRTIDLVICQQGVRGVLSDDESSFVSVELFTELATSNDLADLELAAELAIASGAGPKALLSFARRLYLERDDTAHVQPGFLRGNRSVHADKSVTALASKVRDPHVRDGLLRVAAELRHRNMPGAKVSRRVGSESAMRGGIWRALR